MAASSEATGVVELLELENQGGPGAEAFRTGRPVRSGELGGSHARHRWTEFGEAALSAGFRAVTAVPMRLRGQVLGALNLFLTETVDLTDEDLTVAQGLADLATIAILQDRLTIDDRTLISQLRTLNHLMRGQDMTDRNFQTTAGPPGYDPSPLDVSVRSEDPSALVIEVRGELDLFTGPMLKQHLEPYNDPSGNNGHPRRIVYRLPELQFMDARGLHYLLNAVNGYGSETITVREPSSSVYRLLELVGLDSMIEEGANR